MTNEDTIPQLDGAIVRSVVLIDQITRTEKSSFQSTSLPGHLIHIVTAGHIEQQSGGVKQHVGPGDAVWYHENESIAGRITHSPCTFYTVNFIAPTLSPPPLDQRVKPVGRRIPEQVELLLQAWRDTSSPPTFRHIRIHALLLDILFELIPDTVAVHHIDSPTRLWWDIETKVRANLSQPIDLACLAKLGRRSQRSIIRACHAAVGLAPMKRIKVLRLSYAQGLVLHSQRSMTDVALSVGYGRVQEFSRDYRRRFGITPTEDRKAGPRYRQLDIPDGVG
ncbi:MAG: helix-turn-helix domain-containing protein [Fuerstiella sp.]|nr:helix-turn-helix domain-containing protein [Fuerstiella sp.]MCP4855529.1 helix-turn-helix domain-containing protein [Fuerstiella sp.]